MYRNMISRKHWSMGKCWLSIVFSTTLFRTTEWTRAFLEMTTFVSGTLYPVIHFPSSVIIKIDLLFIKLVLTFLFHGCLGIWYGKWWCEHWSMLTRIRTDMRVWDYTTCTLMSFTDTIIWIVLYVSVELFLQVWKYCLLLWIHDGIWSAANVDW